MSNETGFWLDTPQYQYQRRVQMDGAQLGRVYYEGNPYEISARNGNGMFRLAVLEPLGEYELNEQTNVPTYLGTGYDYDYNISKARIDQMVAMILPKEAQFHIDGLDDDEEQTKTKELLSVIADLGAKYPSTPVGILQWMRQIITDAAQTGDGLVVPRYIPESETPGGFVRLTWQSFIEWDAELDPEGEDVQFYRIQKKRWANDGKSYWVRWDIFPDEIVRYEQQEVATEPPWFKFFPGLELWDNVQPWFFPGNMQRRETKAIDKISEDVLKQIGGLLPVPVRYNDIHVDGFRGTPECLLPDFRSIDKANLHLGLWSKATEDTNYPALIIADAVQPKDAQGQPIVPNMKAGSQHFLASMPEQMIRAFYPENIPQEFGFADVLEQFLQISFAQVPHMGRTPEDLRAFSELSGYAHNVIYSAMASQATDIRDRAITDGIIVALNNAMILAKNRGVLPEGIESDKIEFKIIYPRNPITADETLKLTINAQTALNMGVPAENVVPTIPLPMPDPKKVVDAIEEQQEEGLLMDKAVQAAKQSANGLKGTDDGDNIDNKAG